MSTSAKMRKIIKRKVLKDRGGFWKREFTIQEEMMKRKTNMNQFISMRFPGKLKAK